MVIILNNFPLQEWVNSYFSQFETKLPQIADRFSIGGKDDDDDDDDGDEDDGDDGGDNGSDDGDDEEKNAQCSKSN